MKTKIISIFVLLLMAANVMGEDLAYFYMNNGQCVPLPISTISKLAVSKLDMNNIHHSDYQTQKIVINDTIVYLSLSEIDSIVFCKKEISHYPQTESEIKESIGLSNTIASQTEHIVDSLSELGETNINVIVEEIRNLDGVIMANADSSVINIVQKDGICINKLMLIDEPNYTQGSEEKYTKSILSALAPQRTKMFQDSNGSFIVPHKKALILAPFQSDFMKDLDYLKRQLENVYETDAVTYDNNSADILKFKGDFLSQFDLIFIDTHGGCGSFLAPRSDYENGWLSAYHWLLPSHNTTVLTTGSQYNYDFVDYYVNKTHLLSWDQIFITSVHGKLYMAMDYRLIDGHSFDGSMVFASACLAGKDQSSGTSLMKAFINNGASLYAGFEESINSKVCETIGAGLFGLLSHGVSFQDAKQYWINSSYLKITADDALEIWGNPVTSNPDIFVYQVNPDISSSKIFLKDPNPSLSPVIVEKESTIFTWDTALEGFSSYYLTLDLTWSEKEQKFEVEKQYNYFNFSLVSDLYVDGQLYKRLNDGKTSTHTTSEFSAGEHTSYILCSLYDDENNIVCTYSSDEQKFTIPGPLPNLVISQNSVELSARTTTTVEITSGSGNYTVSVDEPTIAAAALSESVVTIKGLSEGPAVVTVKDNISLQTADIKVKVNAPDPSEKLETFTVNGVSFTMVNVEGGTFMMGKNSNDNNAASDESPRHLVSLSNYSIGQTEVTQALWTAVMGSNPSKFTDSDQLPVDCVSWDDCQSFVTKLNELTGQKFRLPTEAEWEFAARGGLLSQGYKYSGSDNIDEVAWYKGNAGDAPHVVATKAPNELGLYDMSGNSRELVSDWYGSYKSDAQANPTGPSSGSNKVERGGSWYHDAKYCRISSRYYSKTTDKFSNVGLRIAQSSDNDERFDQIIPEEILAQIEEHMPIFDGSNPPNIEGEYLASPWVLAYDVQNQFEVGHLFDDEYLKFYNQDMVNNTIDLIEKQSTSVAVGTGSFISGEGTHFTIYFNTEGVTSFTEYDVTWKEALVISGTKTSSGIGNLYYGFVLLEKSDDPIPKIVDVGHYRVLKDKDGNSPYYDWYKAAAPKRAPAYDWSLPGSNFYNKPK